MPQVINMNKPFRVCLLPVLLAFGTCGPMILGDRAKEDKKKRSAANEGLK
jgi:hypothetical protein